MDSTQIQDIYPLTPTQEGILFHCLSEPDSAVYVEQAVCKIDCPEQSVLQRAFELVVGHFDVLRTSFFVQGVEKPVQLVHKTAAVALAFVDMRHLPEAQREARVEQFLSDDRAIGFDIKSPPLLRVSILQCGPSDSRLVWTNHHLLLDGWSTFLVIDELFSAYDAVQKGIAYRAKGAKAFKPFVKWILGADRQQDEKFYREYLRGFRQPTRAPFDPQAPGTVVARAQKNIVHEMPGSLLGELRESAREKRLTLNSYFQGAYAWLLSTYAGDDDVTFGTAVHGRPSDHEGVESMVGLFINTVPARIKNDPGLTVDDFLAGIQRGNNARRPYEHTPLSAIQSWCEIPAHTPMFETLLAVETFPASPHFSLSDVQVFHATNYKLTLVVEPGRRCVVRALFDGSAFSDAAVRKLLERYEAALTLMMRRGYVRLGELPFSTSRDTEQLARWNQTARPISNGPVYSRFVEHARTMPQAVAVTDAQRALSYGELLDAADALAASLQQSGVVAGEIVGMLFEPSVDMIVAAVGIARAGCAYAPLDPTQPRGRLNEVLARLAPRHLVSHRALPAHLELCTQAAVTELSDIVASPTGRREPAGLKETDLLYVMHTSGSTGVPKAAGVYHGAFVNLMSWWNQEFELGAADRVLLINKISFDLLQKNFWGALMTGGEVHVVPEGIFDPDRVRRWITEKGITWMNCTPSMAYALLGVAESPTSDFASLRCLMLGGEPVQKERFAAWLLADGCRTELVNTYGPTESTDLCCVHRFSREEFTDLSRPVTVGRALPNIQLHVLDRHWRPMPAYCLGEVVIAGASVGVGYLGSPGTTAAKFIPDFVTGAPGQRLYRTGDVGYIDGTGQVIVRGRVDFQVKLRGQRVELDEIDCVLRASGLVDEAVTVINAGQSEVLVSYVVCRPGLAEGWRRGLRNEAAAQLPRGWVPAAYVAVASLPLNDNGKVDRARLPEVMASDWLAGDQQKVAPRTETEQKLHGVWAAVLAREDFGVLETFFDLGGDSLSITQVYSRITKVFGVKVPLPDLFEHETVEEQAELIDGVATGTATPSAVEPRERPAEIPLSPAQQSLWWSHALDPESPAYHVPHAISFVAPVRSEHVERAVRQLIARHESLRLSFHVGPSGEPFQQLHPGFVPRFDVRDCTQEGPVERESLLCQVATEQVTVPFDLSVPPVRFAWVGSSDGDGVLFIVLHHLVCDGWSLRIMERELRAMVHAEVSGQRAQLGALPVQYPDYALWQRDFLASEDAEAAWDHWREELHGSAGSVLLPFDREPLGERGHRGRRYIRALSVEVAEGLKRLSATTGSTHYEVMLAAFQAFLYRLSGQEDFSVGSPAANRQRPELEGVVGMFVNTLVMRAQLQGDDRFDEHLRRTKKRVRQAQAHQSMPFERLAERLGGARSGGSALFNVMFSVQAAYEDTSFVADDDWVARFDLQVVVSEVAGRLQGVWEYPPDLLDDDSVRGFAEAFEHMLRSILKNPGLPLNRLRMCAEARGDALTQGGQTVRATYPSEVSVEALFDEVASLDPQRVAVRCSGRSTSYGELRHAAGAVAEALRCAGIKPGERVGIGLGRSERGLAAMLGVLFAGAVYVPLDPTYPVERLRFMADDSDIKLIVVDDQIGSVFADLGRPLAPVCPAASNGWTESMPLNVVGGARAAYVMYTSGTTGQPKGVTVPHRAIIRLVQGQDYCPMNGASTLLHVANTSFDASTFEVWGALLNGGRVVVYPETVVDLQEVAGLIDAEDINTAFLTSGLFNLWARTLTRPTGLRYLLSGGEALTVGSVQKLYASDSIVRFSHVYGPTEATTFSSHFEVPRSFDWRKPVPIGTTLNHGYLRVLDEGRAEVPPGVVGELFIGGDGLALGYHGLDALTDECFVPDPWLPGQRMYRTGDRVRLTAAGEVLFVGRVDSQVKLRGFRIELGEVRAELLAVEGVADCVVSVADSPSGDRQLRAHVVLEPPSNKSVSKLRAALRVRLPEFMVPSQMMLMERFPLNPSGKVDLAALPLGTDDAAERTDAVPPAGTTEESLWTLLSELLATEAFGVTDDFFDLGGHSLLASRFVTAVEQNLGVKVPLRDFFASPNVRSVATMVDFAAAGPPLADAEATEVGTL